MSRDKWRANAPQYIFITLLAFHIIGNILWIQLNNIPPAWDQASHTSKSIFFSRFISSGNKADLTTTLETHYGPFIYFVTGGLLSVTGLSIKLAQYMGTVFFVMTLITLYLIGRDVFKDRWSGVFAAYLFSFGHIIYDYSRWLLLDIPIVFFVLISTYFFIKSNTLRKRGESLLVFLFITMAIYTKIQSITYFILPLLYAFFVSIKHRNKQIFIHLLLGTLLVTILFFPWLLYRWNAILNYYRIVATPEPGAYPTNSISLEYWLFYLKLAANQIFTVPILLLTILMGIFGGWRAKYPWKSFIIFQAVSIYILFSFLVHKDIRYIFPAIAFYCLAAGVWIKTFIKAHVYMGLSAVFIMLVLSLSQYTGASFGVPQGVADRNIVVNVPLMDDLTLYNTSNWPVVRYISQKYPQEKILNDLSSFAQESRDIIRVGVFMNVSEFNDNNLYLHMLINKPSPNLIFAGTGTNKFHSVQQAEEHINSFDYLIFSPERNHMTYQLDVEAYKQIETVIADKTKKGSLKVVKMYPLPSDEHILLLKNETFSLP